MCKDDQDKIKSLEEENETLKEKLRFVHSAIDLVLINPQYPHENKLRLTKAFDESAEHGETWDTRFKSKKSESGQAVEVFLVIGTVLLLLILAALLSISVLQADGPIDFILPAVPPVIDGDLTITRDELKDMPLTEHAAFGHPERNTDAGKIRDMIVTRSCSPVKVYICSDEYIIYCMGNDNKLTFGLFVGKAIRQVISGLTSRESYWTNKGKACIGPYLLP